MIRYAILANPGHNRVYFEESKKLSISELSLAVSKLSVKWSDIESIEISGVFYISFTAEEILKDDDMSVLSRLSFIYAVFIIKDNGLLKPVGKPDFDYTGSELNTVLKYQGKTNEIFTRLLVNTALFSSSFSTDRIKLLDPVAGKGTTLFEGIMSGFDVYGTEIGSKAVKECVNFFKKYLENGRYKHTFTSERIRGENKKVEAERFTFNLARNKDEFKSGDTRHFEILSGDSSLSAAYYPGEYFHIIAGDLPYGIQHGNVSKQKKSGLTRNPKELVFSCIDGWYRILKPGGVLALSWNVNVLPRTGLSKVLEHAGLAVMNGSPYQNFEHRVDRSIKRDIIVAKK